MFPKTFCTFLIIALFSLEGLAQIHFYNTSVAEGLKIAKREGKNLFVDTYAEWCIPCKKMQRVFRDRALSDYFNTNYINVKVDMDGRHGKETYKAYDVVFLPTMMILDPDGNVKYKTDQIMSAQRLLEIGQQANIAGVYLGNEASQINSNPFNNSRRAATTANVSTSNPPKSTTAPVKKSEPKKVDDAQLTEDDETIVYVLGAGDAVPPEILYEEAYFRMQLMDGSHRQAAKAYLDTQKDWSTDRNLRFIFHFVESTDSPLFDYMINNRVRFDELMGAEAVRSSIGILVNQRIYQGFPRPSLEEAKALYAHAQSDFETPAYQYYFGRLEQEADWEAYLTLADDYLTNVNPKDVHLMTRASNIYLSHRPLKKQTTEKYIARMQDVIKLKPKDPHARLTLGKLFMAADNIKKAKQQLEAASLIMDEKSGELSGEIEQLLQKLSQG